MKRCFNKIVAALLVLAVAGIALVVASAYKDVPENADTEFDIRPLVGEASDYSDKNNWLAIPEITHDVDTIYLYPTSFLDGSEGAEDICDIDNESMRTMAQGFYKSQATVYEKSTEYYERMIVAYPIGFSVTQKWLDEHPHTKFAEGAYDTGVIVSWNTEDPGNKDQDNLGSIHTDGGYIRSAEPARWRLYPVLWKHTEKCCGQNSGLF